MFHQKKKSILKMICIVCGCFIGVVLAGKMSLDQQIHTNGNEINHLGLESVSTAIPVPTATPKKWFAIDLAESKKEKKELARLAKIEEKKRKKELARQKRLALQRARQERKKLLASRPKREQVVTLAQSYQKKITYLWGGKPSDAAIRGEVEPVSLDCSGFIQFIFSRVEGRRIVQLGSTIAIAQQEKISRQQLRPGDIGLKHGTGSLYYDAKGKSYAEPGLAKKANQRYLKTVVQEIRKQNTKLSSLQKEKKKYEKQKDQQTNTTQTESFSEEQADTKKDDRITKLDNEIEKIESSLAELRIKKEVYSEDITKSIDHVGIYCGTDSQGKELWCHCSSAQKGVVCENTDQFTTYFRYY